jgi:hypothetical protein
MADLVEPVEHAYPHIARWVTAHGCIEIGSDGYSRSFVRALDEGGMVWEGAETYPSLDAPLRGLDSALQQWLHEQLGE